MVNRWHNSRGSEPECPRCADLRDRAVKMATVAKGPPQQKRVVITAYECPSCDYVIVVQPYKGIGEAIAAA